MVTDYSVAQDRSSVEGVFAGGGEGRGGVMEVWGRSSDASCEKFNMKNAARRNKETTLMTAEASRQEAEL